MSIRTVRLDEDSERLLEQLKSSLGIPMSSVFKRGLEALRAELKEKASRSPYDVYRDLDLGPGGYSTAPSTDVRRGVREAIARKLGR